MSRFVFKLPDIGEGTAEAELVAWHVKPGDDVAEDQTVVEVMTDKATVEISSPVAGKIVSAFGRAGERIAVGSELLVFELAGEGAAPAAAPVAPPPIVAAAPAAIGDAVEPTLRPPRPAPAAPGDRPLASPAVRRRAWELGVALQFVPGSGPGGRITHADLDAFLQDGRPASPSATPAQPIREAIAEIKVVGLRRVIAERMQNAKRRIPHFSYVEEIDVTALEDLRAQLNAQFGQPRGKLTVLPFLAKSLVRTLPDYPQINARFDDDAGIVRRYAGIHIGMATQTPTGLVVPVLKHVESMSLWTIAAEVTRLAEAARAGKAAASELAGSTITITSLGPLGGLASTPVINYPEVAIVGVNKIAERPVVRGGQIVVRKMMNLSSSFDHRVVDGWDAAEFIQRLRFLLEQPALLLVD